MIQIKQTDKGQEILRVLFGVYFNKSFMKVLVSYFWRCLNGRYRRNDRRRNKKRINIFIQCLKT